MSDQPPPESPATPPTTDHLICLDQFLKATSLVETGGMAKQVIQSGQVKVNGEVETRRRKKLFADDVIEIEDRKIKVSDAFIDDEEAEDEAAKVEAKEEQGIADNPGVEETEKTMATEETDEINEQA